MEKMLSVAERQMINDMLKTDDELKAFYKQLTDHTNAQKELDKIMTDAKNKKIHKLIFPSIGGIQIEKRADDKDIIELFKKQQDVFSNSIKGINGQITHRNDIWNEELIKIIDFLFYNLQARGINPMKTKLTKFFKEETPVKKEEGK